MHRLRSKGWFGSLGKNAVKNMIRDLMVMVRVKDKRRTECGSILGGEFK